MKIIVLSISQYKEKDGIVTAISSEETITFLARGIFDPKKEFAALNNALTIADVELTEGNFKYKTLKSVKILSTPIKLDSDLDYYSTVMLLTEITKLLFQDEEKYLAYNWLHSSIENLKVKSDPFQIAIIYLAQVLNLTGYAFEVNSCVFCGSKENIKAFSFEDGGFICEDCLKEFDGKPSKLSVNQMKIIRYSFNAKEFIKEDKKLNRDDEVIILNKFFEFIRDNFGYKLSSSALIK